MNLRKTLITKSLLIFLLFTALCWSSMFCQTDKPDSLILNESQICFLQFKVDSFITKCKTKFNGSDKNIYLYRIKIDSIFFNTDSIYRTSERLLEIQYMVSLMPSDTFSKNIANIGFFQNFKCEKIIYLDTLLYLGRKTIIIKNKVGHFTGSNPYYKKNRGKLILLKDKACEIVNGP